MLNVYSLFKPTRHYLYIPANIHYHHIYSIASSTKRKLVNNLYSVYCTPVIQYFNRCNNNLVIYAVAIILVFLAPKYKTASF